MNYQLTKKSTQMCALNHERQELIFIKGNFKRYTKHSHTLVSVAANHCFLVTLKYINNIEQLNSTMTCVKMADQYIVTSRHTIS